MNCKDVRKYLYAFADGELETSESLAVLEHLNMCPSCAAKVSAQQRLRSAVARVMASSPAPAGLDHRVREAVAREARGRGSGGLADLLRRRYGWPALAAAALIALVVVVSSSRSPDAGQTVERPEPGISLQHVGFTDTSPAAVRLADMVYRAHEHCCAMGPDHHHPDLPRDGVEAARLITERLGVVPMLRCEQLDGVVDGQFESARLCRLVNPDGDAYDGGHLIYRLGESDRVSLISIRRLPEVAELRKVRVEGRAYALLRPGSAPDDALVTVVVFDCPKATHIVCAPLQPDRALRLAGPLRFAMERAHSPGGQITLAAAASSDVTRASFPTVFPRSWMVP